MVALQEAKQEVVTGTATTEVAPVYQEMGWEAEAAKAELHAAWGGH